MIKLGILGGSFNPIHKGHIKLGQAAYNEFKLDKVIFIPSGISYFKRNIYMPSGKLRLSMVDIAIENIDYFESSNMEILRPGDTHTVDTLYELKKIYPESELYFIAGADTLYSIEKWVAVDEIFKLTNLIISVRNGTDLDQLKIKADELSDRFNAKIEFIKAPNLEISSSQIRENIGNSEFLGKYLDKGVIDFINNNEIYI